MTSKQWKSLCKSIQADSQSESPRVVFGEAAKKGAVYRWGWSCSTGQECDETLMVLSALATGAPLTKKKLAAFDFPSAAQSFTDGLSINTDTLASATESALWAAALPELLEHLTEPQWWNLLGAIQDYRDGISHHSPSRPQALISVAEIGLTLAWRLSALPSCRRLQSSSVNALSDWMARDDESIAAALMPTHQVRLALASLVRCKRILKRKAITKKKSRGSKKGWLNSYDTVAADLAGWVIAMTRHNGTQTLGELGRDESKVPSAIRDDLGEHGLLLQAAEFDNECLPQAVLSALGDPSTDGKLAWQVSLPESLLHDEDASLACILPEWDVRRGRMIVSYDQPEMCIELSSGKSPVISGNMQTYVAVDGVELVPSGSWVTACEYTDDDVHYLELELPYEGGYLLQRQLMSVREDRCCYVADAVLRGHQQGSSASDPSASRIDYQLRLPLPKENHCEFDTETTDFFLMHKNKRRALVLPLSASEWRMDPSNTKVLQSEDQNVVIQSHGTGQLYTPLWIDFYRQRFRSKRTWRPLTVAHSLATTPPSEAMAFRIQMGAEQWVLYRSLADRLPRTFMGKQMIADFYSARFDAEEQSYEELVTVDDSDASGSDSDE